MFTLGSGVFYAQAWYAGGVVQKPSFTLGTTATGGALSNGTYYVVVAAYNANGVSQPAAEQSIVLSAGGAVQKITATITAPVAGPAPTGYNAYLGTVSGYTTIQGTTATTTYNQTAALTTTGIQARFVGLLSIGEVGGDISLDVSWQEKEFNGQSNFPLAWGFYGGKATIKASKVETYPVNLAALAGATFAQTGTPGTGTDVYTYGATTLPPYLYVTYVHTRTDAPVNHFVTVEAFKCLSKSLALAFMREDINTQEWTFDLMADSTVSNKLIAVSVTQ